MVLGGLVLSTFMLCLARGSRSPENPVVGQLQVRVPGWWQASFR